MAIDDPIDALNRHFELEDSSRSRVAKGIATGLSKLPLLWPLDKLAQALKDSFSKEDTARMNLMFSTCASELKRHEEKIASLSRKDFGDDRVGLVIELAIDAARKAQATRSKERIERIGKILANAAAAESIDADDVEEMMRIAMNLADRDVHVLKELVRIHGDYVARHGRIDRPNASTMWEKGEWGNRVNGELESTCNKLESFGLAS